MTPPPDPKADSQASTYDDLYALNKTIGERYHRHLLETLENADHHLTQYLAKRGLSLAEIEFWQLGYAPAEWRFMTERLIEIEGFNLAVDLGVCTTKNEKNHDVFHDRLLIPRHDEAGRLIGFSARSIGEPPVVNGSKLPKYLNTRETVLFRKSEVLFGLHKSLKAIKQTKHVTLTEGDFDAISLHRAGFTDTVAKGGTALTEFQIATIARLAKGVTLIYDVDINEAGQKAQARDVDALLDAGLMVKVFTLPQPRANTEEQFVKVDADSWVQDREFFADGSPLKLPAEVREESEDGLLLVAEKLLKGKNLLDRVTGLERLIELLSKLDGMLLIEYEKLICKQFDIDRKELVKLVDKKKKPAKADPSEDDDDEEDQLPEWVDRKDFLTWGFAPRHVKGDKMKTGYYFSSGLRGLDSKPLTNFIINPLYHIKDRDNVRRLVEIDNGLQQRIIEVNSKFLLSLQNFEEGLSDLGHYGVDIGFERKHLKRLANFVMDRTPEVFPVKTLGYQPEGFFAFSNAVYNGHLESYNKHGVVEVGERHYFSPALSPVFDNYRQDGDDPYKYDKYLSYQKTGVTFSDWSRKLRAVYGERAMVGVVFAVVALFKDVVRQNSKIPLMYCYGPKDSGKSQFAESLMYLFFSGKDADGKLLSPLNLGSSPTTSAFWTAMSRFRNCPYVFNEFDDQKVDPWVFSAFKAAWDGEGRTRQSKENKNLTEEQAVHCAPVLVGQYLSTRDDGSVTSRSLVFEFVSRKDEPFTPTERANFTQLKDWEQAGLNGILTEILPHRPVVVERFQKLVRSVKDELSAELEAEGQRSSPRTLENISCLLAMYDTLDGLVNWPMTRAELWEYSRTMIGQLASLMQETDALGNFWSMLEYLLDRKELVDGWDFKIMTAVSLKVTAGTGKFEEVTFDKPTRLLYLRMNNVHKPYAEYTKRQGSEQPHRQQTIEIYIRQQSYYVGGTKGIYFTNPANKAETTVSSCLVIRYDELVERAGINLERFDLSGEQLPVVTYNGQVVGEVKPHQQPRIIEFRLQVTTQAAGQTQQFNVKCFSTEVDLAGRLQNGTNWKVTGLLNEKSWNDPSGQKQTARSLDVQEITQQDASAVYSPGFSPGDDKTSTPF